MGNTVPMSTNNQPALLVVDVQQGFDDAGYWGPRNNPDCEANIGKLLEHWREQDRPVVFIRHDSTEEHSPLRPDHPGNAFKPVVTGEPDVLISKHTNSCFYGDPDLHAWLQERGIQQLVLCGITTNHCCETTARMAGNLGLRRALRPGRHAHVRSRRPDGRPARPRDRDQPQRRVRHDRHHRRRGAVLNVKRPPRGA